MSIITSFAGALRSGVIQNASQSTKEIIRPTALKLLEMANNPTETMPQGGPLVRRIYKDTTKERKHAGYHGGTLRQFAQQIENGQVENRGRFYFDSIYTAAKYGIEKIYSPYGYSSWIKLPENKKNLPIVIRVSSDDAPDVNDLEKDLGLFEGYTYFKPNRIHPVYITDVLILSPDYDPAHTKNVEQALAEETGTRSLLINTVTNFFKHKISTTVQH